MDVRGQIHTCRIQPGNYLAMSDALTHSGVRWIRFGDELAVWSTDQLLREFLPGISTRLNTRFSPPMRTAREQDLFIVTQKGHLFQVEHPDVPVIIDKGRYLLVELTEAQAQGIKEPEEPRFALRRFEPNTVVFDAPGRPPTRRASPIWVQQLVDAVREASIRSIVEKLVSFRTRYSMSAPYNDAANWVKG